MRLSQVDVGHLVAHPGVLLELDVLFLGSDDVLIGVSTILNFIPILLELGNGQEVGNPLDIQPHLERSIVSLMGTS